MAKRQLQSAIGTHAVKHSFLEIERKRDEMELHEIHLPSVADYVAAFQATEARITPKQRELLLVHHRAQARVTSATRLAEAVGFENYNAVNLQYRFARSPDRGPVGDRAQRVGGGRRVS